MQLYCTPAVNLFTHEGEPVDLNGRQTEYRILSSSRSPDHFEVFSIEQVEGWLEGRSGRGERRIYTAFESFQHEVERDRGRTALYYRVRAKDSVRGDGFDHYMSFVRGDESDRMDRQEAISLTLTCPKSATAATVGGRGSVHGNRNHAGFCVIQQYHSSYCYLATDS